MPATHTGTGGIFRSQSPVLLISKRINSSPQSHLHCVVNGSQVFVCKYICRIVYDNGIIIDWTIN